jgi:alpha,alpha-trehalase
VTVRPKPRSAPAPSPRSRRAEAAPAPKAKKKVKADAFATAEAGSKTPAIDVASLEHAGPRTAARMLEDVLGLDLNHDGRLDAKDEQLAQKSGRDFGLSVTLSDGTVEKLEGPERLAHAADVLATQVRTNGVRAPVPDAALVEPPGAALSHAISDAWPALVRRSNNVTDLAAALQHSNLPAPDGKLHVWVPASDPKALETLRHDAATYNAKTNGPPLEIDVFEPGLDWRELDRAKPGILYLPHEFVVPGGRFAEMYGWDSYFMGEGLIASGKPELAASMLRNQVYLLENYGKIPNSSRSYHLSRSQPPFMPRLALELYAAQPTPENRALLKDVAHAAEKELATIWNAAPQRTASGLARFHDDASGPDLEVQRNLTSQGVFSWPDPEADRAARATGWDLSHRFGDHAQDVEPVDLNSQLYRYEKDLADIERIVDGPGSERAGAHDASADQRAQVMQQRMWSDELGLFVDHDNKTHRPSQYESLATFAPLAAGWATKEQAKRVAENLPRFLEPGGLATSSKRSRESAGPEALQWDWPNGWAPLQMIAVDGLRRYGFDDAANEVAYRWCKALLDIAGANNGLLPEKLDVHHVTADVAAAEYGNQGADRGSYWTPREENPQGFGWTNASFVKLRAGLPDALKAALDQGVPPDALFK